MLKFGKKLMLVQSQGPSLQSELQQSLVFSLLLCVQHYLWSPIIRDCYCGYAAHKCT